MSPRASRFSWRLEELWEATKEETQFSIKVAWVIASGIFRVNDIPADLYVEYIFWIGVKAALASEAKTEARRV